LLGLSAHAVWARALGLSIERPRSLTTDLVEKMLAPRIDVNQQMPAMTSKS
jgi:citrate synthase